MNAAARTTTEKSILERLVEPRRATLSPAAAKAILKLRFANTDIEAMHELAQKARGGALTPTERDDVSDYERVGYLVSLLKSKARLSLRPTNN